MEEAQIRKGKKPKYDEILSLLIDISKSLAGLIPSVSAMVSIIFGLKESRWALVISISMIGLFIASLAFRLVFRLYFSDKYRVYERLFSSIGKKDEAVPTATTTAITALAHRRTGQRRIATTTLWVSLAVYAISRLRLELPLSFAVIATLAGACLILQLADAALDYRIRHGLYGTNEYEARQIISFALNHAERTDLDGGLGATDIKIDAATERLIRENWGVATL